MELTKQVVSLELAKKLKELGVKQESYFHWYYTEAPLRNGTRWAVKRMSESEFELWNEDDYASAFTVAELGEMLPDGCRTTHTKRDGWVALKFAEKKIVFTADTEADARAKMLIYLLENKLI